MQLAGGKQLKRGEYISPPLPICSQIFEVRTPEKDRVATRLNFGDQVPVLNITIPNLHSGQSLGAAQVAYSLSDPDPENPGQKIAVVLGGISANRYVSQNEEGSAGWWPWLIGADKCIDPKTYRVLSFDYFGGNGETTGPRFPSTELHTKDLPPSSKTQNGDSPARNTAATKFENAPHTETGPGTFGAGTISTYDQALVLKELLQLLKIPQVDLFVGASYGGMVGLAFAEKYPEQIKELIVLCAAHKSSPYSVGLRTLQRKIMKALKDTNPSEGISLARALAMITYRTEEEFNQRFVGARTRAEDPDSFPVWDYLKFHGDRYAQKVHPEAYATLSRSIDLHQVQPIKIRVPLTVIAAQSDQLVPLEYCEQLIARAQGPKKLFIIESIYGHDAFLKEENQIQHIFENRRKILGSPQP